MNVVLLYNGTIMVNHYRNALEAEYTVSIRKLFFLLQIQCSLAKYMDTTNLNVVYLSMFIKANSTAVFYRLF